MWCSQIASSQELWEFSKTLYERKSWRKALVGLSEIRRHPLVDLWLAQGSIFSQVCPSDRFVAMWFDTVATLGWIRLQWPQGRQYLPWWVYDSWLDTKSTYKKLVEKYDEAQVDRFWRIHQVLESQFQYELISPHKAPNNWQFLREFCLR